MRSSASRTSGSPAGPLADDLDGVLGPRRRRQPLEQQSVRRACGPRCGSGTGDGPGVTISSVSSRGHDQVLEAVGHPERRPQRALAVADRRADDVDHPEVTLDPGDLLGVEPDHPDVGHQVGEHGDLDARLAERRQDLLDVGEEHPVRAHDQHALALEREPMGVEEVGGPVQRHHRLAGARTALHDDDPGQLRADDLVLFHLDGGDDVGELARPRLLERRDQRAVALDLALVERLGRRAEQLVVDAEQDAPAAGEVTTPPQTHRIAPGRPVEGLGDRSPPVDDHRVAVLVGHGEAADVVALARTLGRRRLAPTSARCRSGRRSTRGRRAPDAPAGRRPGPTSRHARGGSGTCPPASSRPRAAGILRLASIPRGTRRRDRDTPAPPRARDGSPHDAPAADPACRSATPSAEKGGSAVYRRDPDGQSRLRTERLRPA